ncbi:chitinase [Streptomyces pluripotens]|uniref:Chitinase n=1 Tax=Streptomyces pluripotens TaxID=1355015 RepID=A0A221NZ48_9ACTN|nr:MULTISPECIES: glycoside hydrolase family 19 protein [Streptomyces]ARP70987.1 chitinase [Streptomyces pluripotens]ASN25240.1 chitinase [Streptomyces pluripotens]KIE27686.1 chitinase [Streptomyces sp. MUSC 125]MCH0559779.1 chitinase [Streptomyces sp. MUM 16J]
MSMKRTLAVLSAIVAALATLALPAAASADATAGTPAAQAGPCATYPAWVSGQVYSAGTVVQYTNGHYYQALHDNPGYSPVVSTWYWAPFSCAPSPSPTPSPTPTPVPTGFPVSQAQFNQMFPNRSPFYTYQGLLGALAAYPGFADTGSAAVRAQEAAAFLANVSHETGGLVYVVEQNTANYSHYCDTTQPYGCPAGQSAYYGRGPLQLSWNFNYKAAGDALGIDLLDNPGLVQTDSTVSWKTALWFWNTQKGAGTTSAHNAIVDGYGFGATIRSINGAIECNGGNPAEVQDRVATYQRFVQILGTVPGPNLGC